MTQTPSTLYALAAVAGLLAAPGVTAFEVTMKPGMFQTGVGGEFVALTSQSFTPNYDARALQVVDGQTGFSTFCLEKQEYLGYNTLYTGVLNDRAVNGGPDLTEIPNVAGDPLSLGTAWLYTLFAAGTLPAYDYGTAPYSSGEKTARKADAGILQNAIWMLEDEQALDLSNYYVDLAVDKFGLAGAKAANDGRYRVGVVNLYLGNTKRQDFLVRLPDAGTTLGMLGSALIGLGLVRRRWNV